MDNRSAFTSVCKIACLSQSTGIGHNFPVQKVGRIIVGLGTHTQSAAKVPSACFPRPSTYMFLFTGKTPDAHTGLPDTKDARWRPSAGVETGVGLNGAILVVADIGEVKSWFEVF